MNSSAWPGGGVMLRCGVIGLGVGLHHARSLARGGHSELALVCDLDEAKVRAALDEFPGARAVADASAILADPRIDLVVVAGYDDSHADQVVAALDNGKHVFVEKPMCLTRGEALRIRDALGRSPELRLSSNLGLRTSSRFSGVRDAVLSAGMGEIYHIEGEYLWGRKQKLLEGWRKDMAFYSIVHGAAVHMVDLVMWITGCRPVRVSGVGNGLATAGGAFRYRDFASFHLEFESGMTARVAAHGGCVHPHFHRLAVYGTDKTFLHDLNGAVWVESSDPEAVPVHDVGDYPARGCRGRVLESFVESLVLPDACPLVPCRDVFDCMSVCFAAEDAVQTGVPVAVEYMELK